MYEESFRTPLIVRWPGVTKAAVNADLVQNLDYAQTFLDICGVKIAQGYARSFDCSSLKGNKPKIGKSLYYQYYEYPMVQAAVTMGFEPIVIN